MTFDKLSRRHLLQGTAALTLGTALPLRGAFAADTTVGFIYVGPRDDYGYNQAHAAGAAALKKMPGVKVVEEENVPETDAVQKTMETMIKLDGATLLFPTSFGYFDPHMLKMATKYPKIRFAHCGGLWTEKDPKNTGSYFGYIDEAQYLNGIVAGTMTKTNKLGFVAAKPIPQVLRNINAFTLGAQLGQPESHDAGDLHRRLVDAGQGGRGRQQPDRPGRRRAHLPRRRPEGRGRDRRAAAASMVCGYHANQAALAPQGLSDRRRVELGSALHALRRRCARPARPIPNFMRGGLKEGFVKMSPYGADGQRRGEARTPTRSRRRSCPAAS